MDRPCSIIVVLLLTGALISNTLQEKSLNVQLEPKQIQVCEGASVAINCTFQPSGMYKVRWYYSQTPILDCRSAYKIPEGQRFLREKNEDWSTLSITFIKANESGWYFCEVTQDIPTLIQSCSNGIQVIVDAPSTSTSTRNSTRTTESQNWTQIQTTGDLPTTCTPNVTTIPSTSSTFPPWWIWLALAVGCLVLLVLIVVIWIMSRIPKVWRT
ncbi:uncharacterized protein LOC131530030 isoform X2 [Onychostoma macrolepis]|uniref:uncharacterized protein LOC131530030 isoform X2 n=1 Tax=Onychostoma macrolepis TaxID=369639 RepID=UPI00272A3B1E|nr:uncharacterized protein LOC131530030 isoform X2 [Onychostoma macrolepis]